MRKHIMYKLTSAGLLASALNICALQEIPRVTVVVWAAGLVFAAVYLWVHAHDDQ